MDARHFDALAKVLSISDSRRRLVKLLAAVPLAGGLAGFLGDDDAAAKDRRRRRKKRHKKGKNPGSRKKGCKPLGKGKVCAGKCGAIKSKQTCGKTVDCGSCDCSPACEECFTCQGAAGSPGRCVPQQAGAPCGDATTCQSGTLLPQGACDGAGVCEPGTPSPCVPYTQCAGNACATSCGDDNDCVAGSYCDAGKCVGDLPNGEICAHDGQCTSGHCVDDVCCDSACDGACRACNLSGSVGTCTTEANGSTCGGGNICCAGDCQECCDNSQCGVCEACSGGVCTTVADGTACGSGEMCCAGECQGCCDSDDCAGSEPVCVSGQCAACSANPGDCPGSTCCDASNGTCAVTCPASAPICASDVCTVCSAANTCPAGCCASDGSCATGTTDAACGAVGGMCGVCDATETCTSRTCVAKPCGEGGVCRVFVTSTTQSGALGGLDGADDVCQGLADAAELPGAYTAWLSDDTGSPSTRFVQSTGPYRLVTGATVANNWQGLTSGTLLAPINRTETGIEILHTDVTRFVYTNTSPDGSLRNSSEDCVNWTSPATGETLGGTGICVATSANWTDLDGGSCSIPRRLYCFQQST